MSIEGQKFYPGETATAEQVLALASEYRRCAEMLVSTRRPGHPLSQARYRLIAIHAIELYLNAFLLRAGHSPVSIRGLHHDFGARTQLALRARLCLRRRTLAHLLSLSETRDYLVSRYDPVQPVQSALNRVEATLNEIAEKATRFVIPDKTPV